MACDHQIDITEMADEFREAAAAAEISGRHTLVLRGERAVAILLSHDEYLALAETVAVAADPSLISRIGLAEQQLAAGDVCNAEVLFVE